MSKANRAPPSPSFVSWASVLLKLEARQETRWKLGLSRIEGLLERLGRPERSFRAVHVAGTNGKGSFCALLEAVLRAAGLRTGLYTSPHLASPVERVRVDGRPAAEIELAGDLEAAFAAEDEPATYFELMTAAAFRRFQAAGADWAAVEVGLGGRLDATNALERPALTVITSIGLDHVEHLGASLGRIAGEKAGILKPGVPCLAGASDPEARAAVAARAGRIGSPLLGAAPAPRAVAVRWEEGWQEVEAPEGRRYRLGLLGRAAAANAALVLAAVVELRRQGLAVPDSAVAEGFAAVEWPGRFQVRREEGRTLVLDGAHNVPALESFLETWGESPWRDGTVIAGVLRDKDWRGMVARLARGARRLIATEPASPRALPAEEFAAELRRAGCAEVVCAPDVAAALAAWRASGARAGAVVGSFYLVGAALRGLGWRP